MKTYKIFHNGLEYKMKLKLKDVEYLLNRIKKGDKIIFDFENNFVFSEKENLLFEDYEFIIPINHLLAKWIKADIEFKETI